MSDLLDRAVVARDHLVPARDGTLLSVRESGNPNSEHTVVFVHGFCLNKKSWRLQSDYLDSRWGGSVRVISYDHRGHGESHAADMSTYTVDTLATDLADVMTALNVRDSVTLAGHSMGGMTVMAYMGLPESDRPIYPDSLVLVATAAGNVSHKGLGVLLASPATTALHRAVGRVPDRVLDPMVRKAGKPVVSTLIRHIGYTNGNNNAGVIASTWSINGTPLRTKAGFLLALKKFDAYGVLPTIESETVVFSGGRDHLTPSSHAEEMMRELPRGVHHHYPLAGHMIMHEVPDLVSQSLESFVPLPALTSLPPLENAAINPIGASDKLSTLFVSSLKSH